MNKEVYRHLLQTYGRRPGVWFGLVTEIVRTLLVRTWGVYIGAQVVTSLAAGDVALARRNIFYFLAVYVSAPIVGLAGDLLAHNSENKQWGTLLMNYYRKLIGKNMSFYRDNQTGYLASAFRQYLDGCMNLVRLLRVDVVRVVLSVTAPIVVLAFVDWRLGAVAFGIILLQMIYVMWSSAKANKYREMSHEIYRKVTGEVADQITNIVAFKSGGVEKEAEAKVLRLSKQEVGAFWLRRKTTMLLDFPRSLLTAGGVTMALLIALPDSAYGPEAVGTIVMTISYMLQILRNVGELPDLVTSHDDLVTKIYPTLQYLGAVDEDIADPARAKSLKVTKGAIGITDVDFSYSTSNSGSKSIPVFRDLSIQIAGGEHVGIVGLSGAGKSTLAGLLMRFDEVARGAIAIDGIDIRSVRQSELRQKIAYVPQEPLLFHRSVRENIAYFNSKATEKDIVRAARAAHAHEFITKLPDGYNTIVGERGIKLSGGQKQRVAIARAVLKNAPIILFDEATSALDSESEQIIQNALPQIMGKHTAIIIAHRLSTVSGLDRIIVMHDGRIVEEGTHEQLLVTGGRYYALWQKQTTGNKSKGSV
ncbi:MAG TPA: ABC transporter ATP-binding protein [Candidatus Limnocylindria bacterium]|nr:ABC transporter ATP-binding protein [Candidatus Limnocylindria bacterium]